MEVVHEGILHKGDHQGGQCVSGVTVPSVGHMNSYQFTRKFKHVLPYLEEKRTLYIISASSGIRTITLGNPVSHRLHHLPPSFDLEAWAVPCQLSLVVLVLPSGLPAYTGGVWCGLTAPSGVVQEKQSRKGISPTQRDGRCNRWRKRGDMTKKVGPPPRRLCGRGNLGRVFI